MASRRCVPEPGFAKDQQRLRRPSGGPSPGSRGAGEEHPPLPCQRMSIRVGSRVRFARASVRRGDEALPRRAGGAALDPASNWATCCAVDGWGTSAARQVCCVYDAIPALSLSCRDSFSRPRKSVGKFHRGTPLSFAGAKMNLPQPRVSGRSHDQGFVRMGCPYKTFPVREAR